MKVAMTMNAAEFGRQLQGTFAASSRTFPEFLNGQALRLASYAIESTPKADANKIAWALGQSNRRFHNKRTGALLKTPVRTYSSAASLSLYRIVNWRRKRVGDPALGGKAMSSPARKMRAAALRATAFIASGWSYSVRTLSLLVGYADRRFVKSQSGPKAARISGRAKGYAIPARFTLSGQVSCTIVNTSLLAESADRTGRRPGGPLRIAERGLAIARDRTAKDMAAHLARKLQKVFDTYRAR